MAKDITEEKNPLFIYPETCQKLFRNTVGRPKKTNEILFSTEPKSIIAVFLSKEKNYINKNNTKQSTVTKKQKTWTCCYCVRRVFHSKSELKEHIVKHNEIFKCDVGNCSYHTKFPSNLKSHKRIHLSDQPYFCDQCTFRTKFISSLKTHIRLHRDERPFKCQFCEYKCNSCSNLKKHCTRIHENKSNDIVDNISKSSDSVQ